MTDALTNRNADPVKFTASKVHAETCIALITTPINYKTNLEAETMTSTIKKIWVILIPALMCCFTAF